jgi:hypothetical protein
MGNLHSGGFGCSNESDEFEPFQDTGGEVRVLIVGLDYPYFRKSEQLEGVRDGRRFEQVCAQAKVEDVTVLYDNVPKTDPRFPTRQNVKKHLKQIGQRCQSEDFFVFFYAGHGENVPDAPPMDEDDGLDEAFVLPGPGGELAIDYFWVDDDLCISVDEAFDEECRVLMVLDCCHSATMADIDSYKWRRRICSISACQDNEESAELDKGGVLSIALEKALSDLALERGSKEFSLETLFKRLSKYCTKMVGSEQKMEMQHANCDPAMTPWPLPRPWWKK